MTLLFATGCREEQKNNANADQYVAKYDDSPIRFEDVIERSGFKFLHQNSKTPKKYMIETMGSGGALLDYDNDGMLDILVLNNALIPGGKVIGKPTLGLFKNLGGEKFKDVTKAAGLDRYSLYAMGVAVGDYDNDGDSDFYVSSVLSGGKLFQNTGKGTFVDATMQAGVANAGKWGTSCVWVDYDKDGNLDLFVANYVKYASLKDDLPCYSGESRIYCIPSSYESSTSTLYRNEGSGKFRDVTEESGIGKVKGKALGVAIWDDATTGFPDIYVACDTVPSLLFRNNQDGTFTEVGGETQIAYNEEGNPHSGMGIDVDDIHNDGKIAVTITNYQGQETCLYALQEGGSFRDERTPTQIGMGTSSVLGFGVLFFDANNDGFKDIFQVNGHVQDDIEKREPGVGYAQPSLLFQNMRNRTFREVGLTGGAPFSTKVVGRGCARGDINNDGLQDLLLTVNNGKPMLWKNTTPTKHRWLMLKLIGTKSNRDGIGAMVTVTTRAGKQRTMMRGASSYLSQGDSRLHFGLGLEDTANVEIRWSSGTVDRMMGLSSNTLWRVREGESVAEKVELKQ